MATVQISVLGGERADAAPKSIETRKARRMSKLAGSVKDDVQNARKRFKSLALRWPLRTQVGLMRLRAGALSRCRKGSPPTTRLAPPSALSPLDSG